MPPTLTSIIDGYDALTGSWINAATRRTHLGEIAEADSDPIDLLVIGGGLTGASIALDAAARGLDVVLVERTDLGAESSGIGDVQVEGGVPDFAHGSLVRSRESELERYRLLTRTAPYLVRPVESLFPLRPDVSIQDSTVLNARLRARDALRRTGGTPSALLPPPRRISSFEAGLLVPTLDQEGLRGAVTSWSAQVHDDARFVLALARTAAARSARIITRCAAIAITSDSAQLRDAISGQQIDVRARVVVNATGCAAGELDPSVRVGAERVAQLVVRSAALEDPRAVLTLPAPGRTGEFVTATPAPDGRTYLAVTGSSPDQDDPGTGTSVAPVGYQAEVSASEEALILAAVNAAVRRPLDASDIIGRFGGKRARTAQVDGERSITDLRRKPLVTKDPDQPITVVGGPFTTYRTTAKDTVDAVVRRLQRTTLGDTADLSLIGAADRVPRGTDGAPPRLAQRYGTEAATLVRIGASDPDLMRPVSPALPILGVEVVFGVLAEGVLQVDDFLDRRVRVGFVPKDRELLRWDCTKIIDRTLAVLD